MAKGGIIHTIAGSGKMGYSGDGGTATEAALKDPVCLAVDGEENVFFSDHHNNVVRKVNPSGTITTVAGTGEMGFNQLGVAQEKLEGYLADARETGCDPPAHRGVCIHRPLRRLTGLSDWGAPYGAPVLYRAPRRK